MGAVVDLPPDKTVAYRRHIVVGRGDTASLASTVAMLRGDKTGRLTGRVAHKQEAVDDARVTVGVDMTDHPNSAAAM